MEKSPNEYDILRLFGRKQGLKQSMICLLFYKASLNRLNYLILDK
ncbi:hypothetical protein PORCRE_653 [Porphyromonas crevioricanis JCM 15906]|uniref:Uncharacterized protein n=1 Tax=Porphyromonas crevioricanis JCM 15906 TaxID=1305617 RepID=T1CGT6_9PORP|nr:hypothetical protein PORCRE_653 [Porphyromonas crevioricanis JCM 15906]